MRSTEPMRTRPKTIVVDGEPCLIRVPRRHRSAERRAAIAAQLSKAW